MAEISRRRLLAGLTGLGAIAVGGAGVVSAARYHGVRRALHAAGVVPGPDRSAPAIDVEVRYGELSSAFAKRPGYGLYVPGEAPTAVLYCLHGRGGSHRDVFDALGVHRFVAAAKLPWAVAAVDGGESFWHPRADGTDTRRMLLDEFIPFIGSVVGPTRPAAIGWSMGGFGVLTASLARPTAFEAVVAASPSLWPSYRSAAAGAFDSPADFEMNDVLRNAPALEGGPVRVDCGEDDVFADAVRELHRRAPSLDVNISTGFHDNATWRSILPGQLDFASRSLPR